jgi:nucleoside phosphorylase
MLALVFPYQAELEAFLGGFIPGDPAPLDNPAVRKETLGGYPTYAWEGRPDWRFVVSGQGKVEAALACQSVLPALRPSAWVLLGSACALHSLVKAGHLVLSDPCIEYDFQHGPPPPGARNAADPDHHPVFRPAHPFPGLSRPGNSHLHSGPVLSADRNVFDPDHKQELQDAHDALAAAWEGAGFHRFLRRNGAKGWELRLITEEACESRPSLKALKSRMAGGFPAVYPLLDPLG